MTNLITLISSGQPSVNPRLIKEATALTQAGYKVTIIYVPISPWADVFDELFFQKYPQINFVRTGYHPYRQKLLYKISRLRRRILSSLFEKLGDVLDTADYSTILFGQELLKAAKQHKADLYIAHNLGALPAAIKAARFHKAKVGFDAEDFHRGEFAKNSLKKKQTELIENKYFPLTDYLTVASPLIGQAYKQIFPNLSPVVINNVFPLSGLKDLPHKKRSERLTLFWFSQTIGKMRGLECVIKAMGLLNDFPIHLTLLGNASAAMKAHILQVATHAGVSHEQIHFLNPVPESELIGIASKFDIGLASEIPYCLNREYCLTNKIFTYLIAGNALVLSDTKAQSQFLEENPDIGSLYRNGDPKSLAKVLKMYLDDPVLLKQHQQNARKLAETKYNWEIESQKFLELVRKTLQL